MPKITPERVGIISKNNQGSEMKILEYRNSKEIIVQFVEHGNLVKTNWDAFCKGNVRNPYDKTVYSIGFIGVGSYKSSVKDIINPQYNKWRAILQRCYDEKHHNKYPTYKGCKICEEWLNYQNFAQWYDENYYQVGNEKMCIDKDILVKGNKIYSPETCIFVPERINNLFVKSNSIRGNLPIGVTYKSVAKRYSVEFKNGSGKQKYIGLFNTPEEAFQAYKNAKEKIIKQTANEYKSRIPSVLYEAMINYIVEITD